MTDFEDYMDSYLTAGQLPGEISATDADLLMPAPSRSPVETANEILGNIARMGQGRRTRPQDYIIDYGNPHHVVVNRFLTEFLDTMDVDPASDNNSIHRLGQALIFREELTYDEGTIEHLAATDAYQGLKPEDIPREYGVIYHVTRDENRRPLDP